MLEEDNLKNVNAIWSSRYKNFIKGSRSSLFRSLLGQLFSKLVRTYFSIPLFDTQCGAKIFRTKIAQETFREPFISRWLFDIEIFFRLPKGTVLEKPVLYWENHTGSKVSFFRDGIQAFKDLPKIRKKYL